MPLWRRDTGKQAVFVSPAMLSLIQGFAQVSTFIEWKLASPKCKKAGRKSLTKSLYQVTIFLTIF